MKNTDFTEQWTAMQKMFLPTSAISAPLRDNAQRFWENQDKVLDSMQALDAVPELTKRAKPQSVCAKHKHSSI
jgi:hypothetical protein